MVIFNMLSYYWCLIILILKQVGKSSAKFMCQTLSFEINIRQSSLVSILVLYHILPLAYLSWLFYTSVCFLSTCISFCPSPPSPPHNPPFHRRKQVNDILSPGLHPIHRFLLEQSYPPASPYTSHVAPVHLFLSSSPCSIAAIRCPPLSSAVPLGCNIFGK